MSTKLNETQNWSPYDHARRLSLSLQDERLDVMAASKTGDGTERFLLLHGNPGSMLDVRLLFQGLSDLGDVAAYDAPGFGRSPNPPRLHLFDLDSMAALAVSMLDHLHWDRAVLVGHSHGGGVAQRVAALWPERVRALMLLGTLGSPPHPPYRIFPYPAVESALGWTGRLLLKLPETEKRRLGHFLMNLPYFPSRATPAEVEQELAFFQDNPDILKNMARVTKGKPCDRLKRDARHISAPTLFLHGTKDRIVPIQHARRIDLLMKRAGRRTRFVPLRGGGHMIPIQFSGRCLAEIRDFLEGVSQD